MVTCDCKGKMKQGKTVEDDLIVDCIKCEKCGQVGFTFDQTKELIRLRELNKMASGSRKIIKVGSSIAALLPKKMQELGVEQGLVDNVRILSKRSLEIEFRKDLF